MNRGVEDKNILDEFAEDFCRVIDKYVKYIVVSGFVAIAHGRKRSTEDIDMVIEKIPLKEFKIIHAALRDAGFECLQSTKPEDIYNYLEKGDSVRYVRKGTFLPPEMEVKFAKDEIDELQLNTRKKLEFTGLDIWFSSIEMNIAFKEEYLKTSKDVRDADHLRIIYQGKLDLGLIGSIKEKIRKLRLKDD